jgi:chromosome segregation ATPase
MSNKYGHVNGKTGGYRKRRRIAYSDDDNDNSSSGDDTDDIKEQLDGIDKLNRSRGSGLRQEHLIAKLHSKIPALQQICGRLTAEGHSLRDDLNLAKEAYLVLEDEFREVTKASGVAALTAALRAERKESADKIAVLTAALKESADEIAALTAALKEPADEIAALDAAL